jgi:hypothetical protein
MTRVQFWARTCCERSSHAVHRCSNQRQSGSWIDLGSTDACIFLHQTYCATCMHTWTGDGHQIPPAHHLPRLRKTGSALTPQCPFATNCSCTALQRYTPDPLKSGSRLLAPTRLLLSKERADLHHKQQQVSRGRDDERGEKRPLPRPYPNYAYIVIE